MLYLGDCLDIMPKLPEKSIDAIIADIPYGTTACKWDVIIPFDRMWSNLARIIKPNGAIVLFGSEPFSSLLRTSTWVDAKGKTRNALEWYRYDWIWDKVRPSGFQIAKYVPMKRHEIISIFSDHTPKWYPIKEKRDKQVKGRVSSQSESSPIKYNDGLVRLYNDKNPQSIIVFSKQSDGRYVHPTQKPVALMEYLIKTYTNEGETVLDFTMGSGSTGVAAKNTNRAFIGIEKDEKYFRIAQERIQA